MNLSRTTWAIVALLIILGAGAAADQLLARPLRDADEEVAALQARLAEFDARVAASHADLSEPAVLPAAMFALGDTAEIAAQFQEQTRAALAAQGAVALSSQVAIAGLGGGYSRISLLLRARFSERALLDFLRDREAQSPLVLIERLDVRLLPLPGDTRPLDATATLTLLHADAAL